jgi:topoisomerase-4 subunit A
MSEDQKIDPADNEENLPSLQKHQEDGYKVTAVSGLYQDWFLDYASYVILERAVPHLDDGLKPVQRRILHAMRTMEDGRYNKVANVIGQTMQYHPHGDASIGDALVNLGQKGLLIDSQGNWGNIYTGDGAAAPRYIEARLSKFALEIVFNPKTTDWKLSYDGRKKEPITLPVKFPLLLAQGVEGIAVGLASKILPHNFNELIDASIACLRHEPFELFPDFPTGGQIDVSRYNDGQRGGAVRVRATIKKTDSRTLVITEIPFSRTTPILIDSILKANEKGKIKIKKIDDNTSDHAEIQIHLAAGISPDKTIDALFACTDCEISISTNSCVIENHKPRLIGVSEMLRISTQQTMILLGKELGVRLDELEEDWHYSSLEKIFFEKRIYKELEKEALSWDAQITAIERALDPYRSLFRREIIREDVEKLTEKPVRRISKFDIKKAEEHIKGIEEEIEKIKYDLNHLTDFTIRYFQEIKRKYGKGKDRKTEIRNFDTIEVTKVVIANEKLYINREEGMVGTGLKKDEYICDCSDIDDIIAIRKDGTYLITKVSEKTFLGKNVLYVNVFKKNDKRTIYNLVYRDGKLGSIMVKRCAIYGITRDKEYCLTKGAEGSQILYLSVNPNGESEVLKIYFKPKPRLKSLTMDTDLGRISIRGRDAQGNILTKHAIHKIVQKEKGSSTLGGQEIWYDADVQRLNLEGRGTLVDVFDTHDRLLVVTKSGKFRVCTCDTSYHFEDDLLYLRKFDEHKVFTAVYHDIESKFYYLKRFPFESIDKVTAFLPEEYNTELILISEYKHPRIVITFGGTQATRPEETVAADEFIAVKSFRAKGKRLTTYEVDKIEETEPFEPEEPEAEPEPEDLNPSETASSDSLSEEDQTTEESSSHDESPVDKYPDIELEINEGNPEQMSLF